MSQHHHRKVEKISGIWKVKKIKADPLDTVSWEAPSNSDISIMFPPEKDPANVGTIQVMAGASSAAFTVDPLYNSSKPVHYKYQIYVYKDKVYARGGSEPEMIIPAS